MEHSHQIAPEDDGNHAPPPGADSSWQESWFLGWYDPLRRAAGFHHVGIARVAGSANVWHWLALDGKVLVRFQDLELSVPTGDMSDFELGPLRVRTKDPLRSYVLEADHHADAVRADLIYDAFTDPFSFSMDVPGVDLGKAHYESLGRVRGTVTTASGDVAVAGFGYQDHSWGPRSFGGLRTHRFAYVTIGDDLFASVFVFSGDQGARHFGYVNDRGTFHAVVAADFDARVADDGHSPRGCDIRVWTEHGRGYRFTCRQIDVTHPITQVDGFFVTDGFGVFESGGRMGTGLLEINERKTPSPEHRQWLGLEQT